VPTGSFTTPHGARIELHYRADTSDWNTLWSCLNEDEYGLRDRRFSGVAFDIGAHIGGVAVGLAVDNPGLLVVAVEPIPANQRLISRNAHDNGVEVEMVCGAVGAPGERQTKLYHNFRGSEIAEHHAFIGSTENGGNDDNWRQASEHDTTPVAAFSYSNLAALYGRPSVIKIDCEGGEYPFLSDPAVANVPLLIGEWHNAGGRTRDDLAALLPAHDVTFSGPVEGPGGFVAVRR